jgi:hypothetical protein
VGGHLHASAHFISLKGPFGQEAGLSSEAVCALPPQRIDPRFHGPPVNSIVTILAELYRFVMIDVQVRRFVCGANKGTVYEISVISAQGKIKWEIQSCPFNNAESLDSSGDTGLGHGERGIDSGFSAGAELFSPQRAHRF